MEYKKYELIMKPVPNTEMDKVYHISRIKGVCNFFRGFCPPVTFNGGT